mmetsp:Transcript_14065/g.18413  ORF Transcript_14065/g.18413 Transcript_14065/m.18413 type:complete len:505 (+) Transcript_14065:165-1679(+)
MINDGVQLAAGSSTDDVIAVLNELIGSYNLTLPLSDNSTLTYAELSNATIIWILLAGFLVFFMHAGFSMLEAGSVRHKNAVNIMFKNIGTIAIGAICYYVFGFAFAYGTANSSESSSGFIGSGFYGLRDLSAGDRHNWFFQFTFAATGATIVSGAVAGRVQLAGYFIIASWMTSFVYPVVSHWIWSTYGFASAFREDDFLFDGCGVIDFAGSGVVHLTGGCAAFWCALAVGARLGRFGPDGADNPIPPHNMALVTLGTFILWFGWYGFNCGSTLALNGPVAAQAAVTTTLSPSAAAVTTIILSKIIFGHFDLGLVLNSSLCGLVSITAGCVVVPFWASIIIGIIGALVYLGASKLMVMLKIDDPVDAIAVHGFGGIWGLLAVGLFSKRDLIQESYSASCPGNASGLQFGTQLVATLTIISWVTLTCIPLFLVLKKVDLLRVPPEFEEEGLDNSEHGGQAAFVFEKEPKEHVPPVKPTEETAKEPAGEPTEKADLEGGESAVSES